MTNKKKPRKKRQTRKKRLNGLRRMMTQYRLRRQTSNSAPSNTTKTIITTRHQRQNHQNGKQRQEIAKRSLLSGFHLSPEFVFKNNNMGANGRNVPNDLSPGETHPLSKRYDQFMSSKYRKQLDRNGVDGRGLCG